MFIFLIQLYWLRHVHNIYIWVYCNLVRRASHETSRDNIYKIVNFNTATSSTFCMSILSLWWLIAVTGCLFLCHGRALCWASSIQLLHCHFIRMQAWHDCIYLHTCIPQEVKHCTSCSQSIASIFVDDGLSKVKRKKDCVLLAVKK